MYIDFWELVKLGCEGNLFCIIASRSRLCIAGKSPHRWVVMNQSQPSTFNILTDAAENSFWIELQRAGLNTDMQTLHAYLTSNCIEQYHPVKSYLDSLPEWDGHDHIADLLGMVHCRDCTPEKRVRCVRLRKII